MIDKLKSRLTQLKSEFESGQKLAGELEMKLANTRETLLRISGAIQVIEEELAKVAEEEKNVPGEKKN